MHARRSLQIDVAKHMRYHMHKLIYILGSFDFQLSLGLCVGALEFMVLLAGLVRPDDGTPK